VGGASCAREAGGGEREWFERERKRVGGRFAAERGARSSFFSYVWTVVLGVVLRRCCGRAWCAGPERRTITITRARAGSAPLTGSPLLFFFLSLCCSRCCVVLFLSLSDIIIPLRCSRTSLGLQQAQALAHRAPPRTQAAHLPRRQQPTRRTHRTGKTCRPRSRLPSHPYHSPNLHAPTRPSIPILTCRSTAPPRRALRQRRR
jgi:hypothetical protein